MTNRLTIIGTVGVAAIVLASAWLQWPAEDELREYPDDHERHAEGKNADQSACAQIRFQRTRVDFRAREKRQHAAAKQREKIDPVGRRVNPKKISRDHPDENFNQRDGYTRPNRN